MNKNDCSVYAVAFTCTIRPTDARYLLREAGRADNGGATDRQILRAVRESGCRHRRFHTVAKTVRAFARLRVPGAFLVASQDHVVAVVDGYVCNQPTPEHSDLYRIEKIWKISIDWT